MEVEIRGKFNCSNELEEFVKKLYSIGKLKRHRHRFSVIFTTYNNEGIDLQVRDYDLSLEVVLKKGEHTSTQREEFNLKLSSNDFKTVVSFFYNLGFKEGVVAEAEDWLFEINNDFEVKATTCDGKIFCWEIEALHNVKKEALIEQSKKLNLCPMNEVEIAEYWKWMKKYANKKFDIKTVFALYEEYKSRISQG